VKTELLGFRALPEEVRMADNLAKQLQCNRSEALRRVLWAASGQRPPHPVVNIPLTNNRHDAQVSQGLSVTAVSA